jgi:hypothetical protein
MLVPRASKNSGRLVVKIWRKVNLKILDQFTPVLPGAFSLRACLSLKLSGSEQPGCSETVTTVTTMQIEVLGSVKVFPKLSNKNSAPSGDFEIHDPTVTLKKGIKKKCTGNCIGDSDNYAVIRVNCTVMMSDLSQLEL